jgi:hypothetical protein
MAKQAKRQKNCLEAKRHQASPSQAKLMVAEGPWLDRRSAA